MLDSWFESAPAEARRLVEPVIEEAVNRAVSIVNSPSLRAEDRSFELLTCAMQLRAAKLLIDAFSRGIKR